MLKELASRGLGLLGSGAAAGMACICICSDLDTIGKGGVEKQNPDHCLLQVHMFEHVVVMMVIVVFDLDVTRATNSAGTLFFNGSEVTQIQKKLI